MVEDEPCTSDVLHEVELLLPFMKDAYAEGLPTLIFVPTKTVLPYVLTILYALVLCTKYFSFSIVGCNQKDVSGILLFHGSVCSFSYLNSKEPISQAVADIKVLHYTVEDLSYSFIFFINLSEFH